MAKSEMEETPISGFHRFLYRNYARGAQFSYFIQSRVTIIAWSALWVLLITAVMGTDILQSALHQIFALVLGLISIALIWAWARRAKFSAKRVLPKYATVGEECQYTVEVANEGRSSVSSFRLFDRVPDPRPSLRVFSLSPEPGEEKRNLFDRYFIYYRWKWLMERQALFTGGKTEMIAGLVRGDAASMNIPIVPKRRGVVFLKDMRVLLPDPMGMFQRCRVVKAPTQSLVVLPKRYRLPPFDLPGDARFQLGGEVGSNTIGASGEFLGLREYRSGDALRHLHWKAWAKLGVPIVKEYEDTYFPRYGLVLDSFTDSGDEDLFEEAVSVAASFATAIDGQLNQLDLMFVQNEAVMVSSGKGVARVEKVLEVLAGVEPELEEHFRSLAELIDGHVELMTSCVCIFSGWSEERANFLRSLHGKGLETMTLIVCREKVAAEKELAQYPVGGRVSLLEKGTIQESLMTL